jgi:hypothetical protein
MTADQLREFKNKVPFKAFTIHMSDGSRFSVEDPEALVLPRDWSVDAIITFPKGRFKFIYLKNVTHVSGKGPWPKMKGRKGKGRSNGEKED